MTDEEVAATVRNLARCVANINQMKDLRESIEQRLVTHMGESESVVGPWGSFEYPWRDGRVAWKRIAEELYEDSYARPGKEVISKETIDRHRGPPWREARLYLNDNEGKEE